MKRVVIAIAVLSTCTILTACGGSNSSRATVQGAGEVTQEDEAPDPIESGEAEVVDMMPTLSCTAEAGLQRPDPGQVGLSPSGSETSFICLEDIPQAPYLPGGEAVVVALDAASIDSAADEKISLVQITSENHFGELTELTEHYFEVGGSAIYGNGGFFIDQPTTIEATVVVEKMPVGNALFVAVAGPNPDDPDGYTIDYQSHPQVSDGSQVSAIVTYDFSHDSVYADGQNFHVVAFRHDLTTGALYEIGKSQPIKLNLTLLPRAAPLIAYNGQVMSDKPYHEVMVFGHEMPVEGYACMYFRGGERDTPYQDRSLISESLLGEVYESEDLSLSQGTTVVGEHDAYFVEVRVAKHDDCNESGSVPTQAVTFIEVGRQVRQ